MIPSSVTPVPNLTAFNPQIPTAPSQFGQSGSTLPAIGQGSAQNLMPIIEELLQILVQLLGSLGGGQGMPGAGIAPNGGTTPMTGGAPTSTQNSSPTPMTGGAPTGTQNSSPTPQASGSPQSSGTPTCKGDSDHDHCGKGGNGGGGGTSQPTGTGSGSSRTMSDLQKVIEDLGRVITDLGKQI